MLKHWIEKHLKLFAVLLLGLAAANGWVAYQIFSLHPVMAVENVAMAALIILGVTLLSQTNGSN